MMTKRFYLDVVLISGIGIAIVAIFWMQVPLERFNAGFLVASALLYWCAEGIRVAHENGGDSLRLALWSKRASNLLFWLLPVSVVAGFMT